MRDKGASAKTANLVGRDVEKPERRTRCSGLDFEWGGGVGDYQEVESVPVGARSYTTSTKNQAARLGQRKAGSCPIRPR